MKNSKRNNIVIASTVTVCLIICVLWATVLFVHRAQQAVDTSSEGSAESMDMSSEDTTEIPDALDALFACNERVEQASSYSSVTHGVCDTQILFFNYRHELFSERFVYGDELYCSDIGSGSLIRYGTTCFIKDDVRLIRIGEVHSLDEILWADQPISVSEQAYSDAFGKISRGLSDYILDKNTVKSAKLKTYTDQTYTFVYELDPSLASETRVKKLKLFGTTEETPSVQSIKMTVVMDREFYPVSVTYEESYSVVLSLIGETTCKSEYTETFSSFNQSITIPEREYFSSFLSLSAVDTCPAVSAGYQLLLSLFEDRSVYEMTVSMAEYELPFELSTDTALGALYVQSDAFAFLYQNDRYYLSHGDIHVYTEASELNRYLLPLFSAEQTVSRAQNNSTSDLFAGANIKTEDGKIIISSSDSEQAFLIMIDTATMSLISAELTLDLSGTLCTVTLTKTAVSATLPQITEYVDITDSVSAVSFLTTLVGGNDLQYTIETEGALQYTADVVLSFDQNLRFSAISVSTELPINLYYSDQTLSAVWNDIAVYGTISDFASLLSSSFDNGIAPVSENQPTHLSDLSYDKDLLTLYFDGENAFTLTLTSDALVFTSEGFGVRLTYRGVSNTPPQSLPSVSNMLEASALGTFLSDSVYLSLLNAGSIGAQLTMDIGAETLSGDLLLTVSTDLSAIFKTNWNGLDTNVVYKDKTVFLSNLILNGFIDTDRIDTVLTRLSAFSGSISASPVGARSVYGFGISCDGESLRINYDGIEIVLKKRALSVSIGEMTIRANDLYALPDAVVITHPEKEACIDLDLLSKRLLPLFDQSTFSFAGTINSGDFSASVSRLDICLDAARNITSAAIDLSPNNSADLYHIVYDGEAIYFDTGKIKLFTLVDPLLASFANASSPLALAYDLANEPAGLGSVRSISYQSDILTVVLDSATVRIKLTSIGIEALDIISDSIKLSLQREACLPIVLPSLDGYIDMTSFSELLPKLLNTAEAGNFDFEGVFDIRVLNMHLKGVALDGTLDFSDEQVKGYICIEVPYLYGLTSENIPLKQGNDLLRACTIKSELYVLGDRIYICRTINATYGYSQSQKRIYTEKRYLTTVDLMLAPEKMLAFVLNLDSKLLSDEQNRGSDQLTRASADPNLLKRFSKQGDKYSLEFNPEAILPSAERLVVFAKTNDLLVTSVGIEATVSIFDVSIACELYDHGSSKLDFTEKDFLSYFPLQD